ncbi:MAG: hypothetical protein NZ524_06045 [Thiobacillaceae bacterium]|nr:hypothetical protein [Thiobacillaceae bacterium]
MNAIHDLAIDRAVWPHAAGADDLSGLPEGGFDVGGYVLALVYAADRVRLIATAHPRRRVLLETKRGAPPRMILLSRRVMRYEHLKRVVLKKAAEMGVTQEWLDLETVTAILRQLDTGRP